jgi:hypothetical protein
MIALTLSRSSPTPAEFGRWLRLTALPVLTYPRTLRSGSRSASPATELDGRVYPTAKASS